MNIIKSIVVFFIIAAFSACAYDWSRKKKDTEPERIVTNYEALGFDIVLEFKKGRSFNHPLMAVWVEDMEGNYVQTLYVAQSIAQGYYRHGDKSSGRWMLGAVRRPATLPYWAHKRGVREADGLFIPTPQTPLPDALTGATPKGDFLLKTKTKDTAMRRFKLLFEINQSWDWNKYWHNDRFPDDEDYKTSSQPALVYETVIDIDNPQKEYILKAVGHSHYSGKTGELFTDLSTITTALDIAESIKVVIEK